MPAQENANSNIYALLIGIDVYEKNDQFDDLGGAARDINLVAEFLGNTLGISEETGQLIKLTSPSEATARTYPKKDPSPTYQNIVKAFNEITARAQSGDQVYIHYSGHGVRAKTIYPNLSKQHDEGLAPMDLASDGRYLRDVEIATLLKRMTDKGLVVTVVLDSCHSGGATRGDTKIRGPRNGTVDQTSRPAESSVEPNQATLEATWKALVEGTPATAQSNWAPASRDYVLLAACRPTEEAYEYVVNPESSSDSYGALTYWMLQTLMSSPPNLSYRLLHDRLCAKIHSKFSRQIPMLIGDGDRKVFGSDRMVNPYTVAVLSAKLDKMRVRLNAGLAQGLSEGAQFAIYPFGTTDFSQKDQRLAIVEVTDNVEPSTCTARILPVEKGGLLPSSIIDSGFPAVMLSAPTALVRRVRLFDKAIGDAEDQLSPELAAQQKAALEKVRQALSGNGWVIEKPNNVIEADYQVAVAKDGTYEIGEGSPIKNLGDPLDINGPNSPAEVVKRLVHLTKFKAVESLQNPDSDVGDQIVFELLDEDKEPFLEQQNQILTDGDLVYVRIINNSQSSLNIALFDLEPTWEVSQIGVINLDEIYYELSKDEIRMVKLRLKAPRKPGYEGAVETLKLFATAQIADFRWMRLPALDNAFPSEQSRGLKRDARGMPEKIQPKGENSPPMSRLNELLAMIGADVDNPPLPTTRAERVFGTDWATKSLHFTVKPIDD
ncbi:caspase family protein [Leptolyngbya sp. ST-U4]|uniref:caspase family protein n=1 Tax=Leptolyngbya sp. ST-U4 TaxID=2933912 RepID=UPI0032979238